MAVLASSMFGRTSAYYCLAGTYEHGSSTGGYALGGKAYGRRQLM